MRECERKLCVAFHVPEQRDGTRSLRFRPGMRRGSSFVGCRHSKSALNWSWLAEDRNVTESQARTCACGETQ